MKWQSVDFASAHEAQFLKLDCSRLKRTFGWRPVWHIDEAIRKTVEWSKARNAGEDIVPVMEKQIREFIAKS